MSTIPNTTQTPNILVDRYMKILSDTALRIILIIIRKTYGWILNPKTGMRKEEDWISYSQLMEFSGRERAAISKALRELEKLNLIDIRDQKGNPLLTQESRRGKKLMYRFSTSMKSELVTINQFGKRTSESEHTKEIHTKVSSKEDRGIVKKQPSCPLLNGSTLKEKYPLGHKECVDYILSLEESRGNKFINQPKQFKILHQILRTGFGFDEMDIAIKVIDKKYGRDNWDFSTISSFIDKGVLNGKI